MTQMLRFIASLAPGTTTFLTCTVTDTDTNATASRTLAVTILEGVGSPTFPFDFPRVVQARRLESGSFTFPGVSGGGTAVPTYRLTQADGSVIPSWLVLNGLEMVWTNPPVAATSLLSLIHI